LATNFLGYLVETPVQQQVEPVGGWPSPVRKPAGVANGLT
jgi:hypothetical protein